MDCPPFINVASPLVPTDWNAKTHTGMDGMGAILKLMAKGIARASSMELYHDITISRSKVHKLVIENSVVLR